MKGLNRVTKTQFEKIIKSKNSKLREELVCPELCKEDGSIPDELIDTIYVDSLTKDMSLIVSWDNSPAIVTNNGAILLLDDSELCIEYLLQDIIKLGYEYCDNANIDFDTIDFLALWEDYAEDDAKDDGDFWERYGGGDSYDNVSLADVIYAFDSLVAVVRIKCSGNFGIDELAALKDEYNTKAERQDDFPYAWVAERIIRVYTKDKSWQEICDFEDNIKEKIKQLTGYC